MNTRINFKDADRWDSKQVVLHAITALAEAAYKLSVLHDADLAKLLTRYLPDVPPRGFPSRHSDSRFPLLRAYTLRAALAGTPLSEIDVAHPELRTKLEKENSSQYDREAREFREDVGALLPWHQLWVQVFLGRVPADAMASAIDQTHSVSRKAESSYQEHSYTADEIAELRMAILQECGAIDANSVEAFNQWMDGLTRPLYLPTLTALARLTARTGSLQAEALKYAEKAFKIARDERAEAESKVDTYVNLSRAVLMASKPETEAYFNAAVEVASKIGDENLSRWGAMLYLADATASETPVPESAYRFARCAELTYDYVYRDKHFDWESTVEAITALCPSSSFAILSRWRDRDFGWDDRLLPIAVKYLLEHGKLNPKLAAALTGFRAQWSKVDLLKQALRGCSTTAEKQRGLAILRRYMVFDGRSSGDWKTIKETCATHGLSFTDIDEFIEFSERSEPRGASDEPSTDAFKAPASDKNEIRDWGDVFSGFDLSVAGDIVGAYRRFKSGEPPYYHEAFFSELFGRVLTGREADTISAFAATSEFSLYCLRDFLDKIPDEWRSRLAVNTALQSAVKTFCRRYCLEISRNRYYEPFPFKQACQLSGLKESDLIEVVLAGVGEASDLADAARLFSLVGLISAKLSCEQSLEVLSFGLDIFEKILEDKDGDGPWSAELAPPTQVEEAVVGYIFAGLASPRASVRWEAAHVVRSMCALGLTEHINYLIKLIQAESGGPFADRRLHFYHLHAVQWGMIAFARAANEAPAALVPHADLLAQLALGGNLHVLIRGFAARIVLALLDSGLIVGDKKLRERLKDVNISPFQRIESDAYKLSDDENEGKKSDDDRFYFGLDIGPYWYQPLGRCFGKAESAIERMAKQVITADWKYTGSNRWDEDERARRNIFKERETYHSHGSYPRTDTLHFYLSYHAMMVVAGKLLATTPERRDKYSMDVFSDWLSRHGLTRQDGSWLSDRRDPEPFDWPNWKSQRQAENWRWSVWRDDFDRVLAFPGDRVNLWGDWTSVSGDHKESVSVRSALVSPQRSDALMRALQMAANPHDYRIPDEGDELEIEHGAFQLKGWIANRDHPDSGIDEQDPWGGNISYPPQRPASFVVQQMGLTSDPEGRTWHMPNANKPALLSQLWGHYQEKTDDNQKEEEHGTRSQASSSFIVDLLSEVGMDLIVAVEIDRKYNHYRYESSSVPGLGYMPESARLFLIKTDGKLYTV